MTRKIYFVVDDSGFKYTGWMASNRKAAQRMLKEYQEKCPGKKFNIDFGYAFTW